MSLFYLIILLLVFFKLTSTKDVIVFNISDISTTIENFDKCFHLEAYRSLKNDEILLNKFKTKRHNELTWYSLGHPTLIEAFQNNNNTFQTKSNLFHFTNDGFYLYIDMLTLNQRNELAKSASLKYGINVSPSQIVPLKLSKYTCLIEITDVKNLKDFKFLGEVTNLNEIPVRVDFKSKHFQTLIARLFQDGDNLDLAIKCEVIAPGVKIKTKVFSLTPSKMIELGLVEMIFGNEKNAKFMTKEQIYSLSREIYYILNIQDDYEMNEIEFQEEFLNGFVRQKHHPFGFEMQNYFKILKSISTYRGDTSLFEDSEPDEILEHVITDTQKKRSSELNSVLKTVNVTFVKKKAFLRKFIFENIFKTTVEHYYSRKFSLYTKNMMIQDSGKDKIIKIIDEYNNKLNKTLRDYKKAVFYSKPRVSTGVFENASNRQKISRKTILFPHRFRENPQVIVSIVSLEMISKTEFFCIVENISTSRFDHVCVSFQNVTIAASRFLWIAIGF
jgi:hypothetical protein